MMSELQQGSPFELLLQLSETGARNALPLPDEQTLQDDWRGIGFRLAGRTYVAPMTEVDEVLSVPVCTKVPGVKNWLNGIANIRGRLLAVVDLGVMLGHQPCGSSSKARLLSIKKDDLYSGVIVDEVFGLQTFSSHEKARPNEVDSMDDAFVSGAFERDGEHWKVFSLYRLAESEDFLNVSA